MEEIEVSGNKEKRYTRHVFFTGPGGEKVCARVVYDYRELRAASFLCRNV